MASHARIVSTLSGKWLGASAVEIDAAVLEMALDIDTRAKILAPIETGALRNSGRVKRLSQGKYEIGFGSPAVPYARRRHFENKKHPQTLGYLAKAGDGVARAGVKKYLRETK